MEDDIDDVVSWWSDSHNLPAQSQWLQSTLSDLDRKTKTIVSCIQGDGDSFAKRAEMFYGRRYELIKLLQELHESYRSLSEKFDILRAQNTDLTYFRPPSPSPSLINASSTVEPLHPFKFSHNGSSQAHESLEITQTSDYGAPCDSTSKDSKAKPDFLVHGSTEETCTDELELNQQSSSCDVKASLQESSSDNLWNNLKQKLSRLIEDNVAQQSELARRNDEKREVIKHLRAQANRLMEENRILRSYAPSYKIDTKRNHNNTSHNKSKLKGLDCIGIGKFRD